MNHGALKLEYVKVLPNIHTISPGSVALLCTFAHIVNILVRQFANIENLAIFYSSPCRLRLWWQFLIHRTLLDFRGEEFTPCQNKKHNMSAHCSTRQFDTKQQCEPHMFLTCSCQRALTSEAPRRHENSKNVLLLIYYTAFANPWNLPGLVVYWHRVELLPSVKLQKSYVNLKNITRTLVNVVLSRKQVKFQFKVELTL